MSLTAEGRHWHERYQQLEETNPRLAEAIDRAFKACRKELEEMAQLSARKLSNSDLAEELIAAITRYYFESE